MPAVTGLLLVGIGTRNSILLVDYALKARRQGMGRSETLLDDCHSGPVFRPAVSPCS